MSSRSRLDVAAQNSNLITYAKPSLTPPSSKSSMKEKKQGSLRDRTSGSRETTPTATSAVMAKSDTKLAATFKSNLIDIKSIVTCSICDQLLYEPYTLACGHTYCYSCLCNWFVPNKRKKTCPECRARVKQLPTPNYLVKSIVDVFTKQTELMPADETSEQHAKRREEENAEVEKDKKSVAGLFKGTFPKERGGRLWMDEEDGVMRCPSCGHEHEGGPSCQVCGEQFSDARYDYSDYDEDDADLEAEDMDNLEIDLDADEMNAEFARMHGHHHFMDMPHFGHPAHAHIGHYPHHFQHPAVLDEATDSNSDGSELTTDSEDEDNSLDGFVVQDDEEPIRVPGSRRNRAAANNSIIDLTSDDESDEGGAISNGRSRHRLHAGSSVSPTPPAVPNALSISDDSTHESDYDETLSEAEHRLQNAGWSPLDNGNDSEVEAHVPYEHDYTDYGASEDDDEHGDGRSDTTTSTIDGNAPHYHEAEHGDADDFSDTSHSETPTYHGDHYGRTAGPYLNNYSGRYMYLGEEEEEEDDDQAARGYSTGASAVTDHDGDTEMSVSSSRSRTNSVTPNPYASAYNEEYDGRGARDISEQRTDYGDDDRELDDESDYGYGMPPAHTYVANAVHDLEPEEESSDGSIRPATRRQPRQPRQYSAPDRADVSVHHYNPFIPEYQGRLDDGSGTNSIQIDGAGNDWDREIRRVIEPLSRTRRMTAYRDMPGRRIDPLRSSRSPSAQRIISSSRRESRYPRQYMRRA